MGVTLAVLAGAPAVSNPPPPSIPATLPGLTNLPSSCVFCGLPVPKSRTGPIVAAGTAIALDGLGILLASSVTLVRRRRHRR